MTPGVVCVVQTADCLPILIADRQAKAVAAIHAGWRGLAEGVIEATFAQWPIASDKTIAWLGPAISAQVYEVGDEVREQMIERLNFVVPTSDIIWRLCSVVFFDETESPYRYDPEYAKTKIAKWKASGKIYDFFLSLRINQLIPLPELSEEDLGLYLKVVNQVSQSQLDNLLSKLTSNQRKAGYYSELNYQKSLVSTGIN